MTPDQIQTKLNILQAELDALKLNLSEIPNSCDHYIPQPGEVVEVSDEEDDFKPRVFVKYDKGSNEPFESVAKGHEWEYRNGEPYKTITWKLCRRLSGEIIEFGCDKVKDYTHLLPTGYEFCTEEQAEKWVKVELIPEGDFQILSIGAILDSDDRSIEYKYTHYRPIHPIQYHVQVHEATIIEPNPYQVDWANAPEDADVHAFDSDNRGCWHCTRLYSHFPEVFIGFKIISGFTLPTGLDWKQSKTTRP